MLKHASALLLSLSVMGWAQAPAAPAVPAPASPANAAANLPVNVPFDWDAAAGAASYHIQVSTDADFDPLAANDSGLTVTERNIGPLQNGVTYRWRVRAKAGLLVSAWSEPRTFTTLVAAPGGAVLAQPADKAVDVALQPLYKWRKLAGASDYDFQLSRNEAFTDIAMERTSLTDTAFTPATEIPALSKRWWRVRGRNVAGTGAWSPAWSFTTVPGIPAVPGLMAPAVDAAALVLPIGFKWHKSDRAAAYRVQILAADGKAVVFDTLIAKGDTVLATDRKLAYGTDYQWHVRAENAGGPSAYSAPRKFSTLDKSPAVTLVAPKADSANAPVSLTLVWNKAARAATYKVQVSENIGFTGTPVVNDSGFADTTRAVGPLKNEKAYYWRVLARNAAGNGDWSAVRKFTTIVLIAPPAPALASPADGAEGVAASPVLKWRPSARAATYKVQLSLSPTFATFVSQDSGKDTTRTVGPLKNGEQYFWRVSARNDAGASAYSEIRSFTVSAAAAAEPVPVAPADNAINLLPAVNLVWKKAANAVTYRVQVSLKADFTTLAAQDTDLVDTTFRVNGLTLGETYHWRVRSQNSAGNSEFSDTRKFTVVIAPPPVPGLVSPADGDKDLKRNLTLKWGAAARAASYRVQVSTSASFATLVADDSAVTDTTRALSELAAETQFFWRVRARNAGGVSPWSVIHSFKTESGVALGRRPIGDGEGFRVLSARGNAGTELEYSVKRAGPVRFTVVNPANGRAFDLVDRDMLAGTYRIAMGPQGRGRGVYFLTLSAGAFRQTQKVFLP